MRRPRGIALNIAIVAMIVTVAATIILAIGVLVVGQASFAAAMRDHGMDGESARAMFLGSVGLSFLGALVAATVFSGLLAWLLARRLGTPLQRVAGAARRMAAGDRAVRVPRTGPEEVVALADSFNQMAEAVERQEVLRRDFVVNAAHELRTPLTNLQGYLEGLRDGVIPASQEIFASLHEEADRLVRLARALDLLAEHPEPPGGEAEETDLVAATVSALQLRHHAFDRAGVEVALSPSAPVLVRVSPDHLAQVLFNLLENAVRYTPRGGRVEVGVTAHGDTALVRISNTGVEIAVGELPHVFERFYRVERSRDRVHGGAGVGLAIVKHLVEAAGGRVGAESQANVTRFWFSLPTAAGTSVAI